MSVFFIGLSIAVLILISALATILSGFFSANKTSKPVSAFYFSCFLFICTLSAVIGSVTTQFDIYEKIAKGVDLKNVTVKGKSTFTSQIRLFYEDGSVKKIEIVPNTTRKEKNGQ